METVLHVAGVLAFGLVGSWVASRLIGIAGRLSRRSRADPFEMVMESAGLGKGMPIYTMNGVPQLQGNQCERAISANQFVRRARTPDGSDIISYQASGSTYLATVKFDHGPLPAVYVQHVAPVGGEGLTAELKKLLAGYGVKQA